MALVNSGLNLQLRSFGNFKAGLKSLTKDVDLFNKSLKDSEKLFDGLISKGKLAGTQFQNLGTRIIRTDSHFANLENRLERQNELFRDNVIRAGRVGENFDTLHGKTKDYSDEVGQLSGRLLDATNKLKNFGTRASKTDLDDLGDSAGNFNRRIGDTPGLLDRLKGGLGTISTGVGELRDRFGDFARRGLDIATTAITGFGIAAGAALTLSIGQAIENQSAFASLAKTLDGTSFVNAEGLIELTEQGEAIKQVFEDLSEEIPVSFAELSELGGLGAQLGLLEGLEPDQFEDTLARFTRTVAGLGEATDLAAEDAATGLTRIGSIFQEEIAELGLTPGENIERLGTTIVELGNTMAATESEILNFATRIAGTGATAGLTQADILAIGASFTSVGLTAEAGGTSVSKALLLIQEAVSNTDQSFIDNTEEIEKTREKLQDLYADLVQVESGQHGLGESLVEQEAAFIAAGGSAELFGRQLGDKSREAAFQTQKEIDNLIAELKLLETQQGQPIQSTALDGFLEVVQKTEDGARLTAESFKELWQKDAGQAFELFVQGLAQEGDRAGQTLDALGLGSGEAQRTFLAMAQNADLLTEALARADEEFREGTALIDETEQRYATLESRFDTFKNAISNAASEIGDVFLPSLTQIVTDLTPVISAIGERLPEVLTSLGEKIQPIFSQLTDGFDSLADGEIILDINNWFDQLIMTIDNFDITELKTSFELLINDVFPAITSGIGFVIENWDVLLGVMTDLTIIGGAALAITGLGTALGFLLSPLGLVTAAVSGLAIAWETNFLGIRETTESFIADFQEGGFSQAFEGIGIPDGVIESGKEFLDGFIQPIKDALGPLGESFSGLLDSVSEFYNSDAVQFLLSGASNAGTGFVDWLGENSGAIGEFLGIVVSTPIEQVGAFLDIVSSVFDVLSTGASPESLDGLTDSLLNFLTLPFNNYLSFITGVEDFSIADTIGVGIDNLSETLGAEFNQLSQNIGLDQVIMDIESDFAMILSNVDLGLPTFDNTNLESQFETHKETWRGIFENALAIIDLGIPSIGGEFGLANSFGETITSIQEAFRDTLASVDLGIPSIGGEFGLANRLGEITNGIIAAFSNLLGGVDLGLPKFPDLVAKAIELKDSIIGVFTGLFDGIDFGLPDFLTDIDILPKFGFGDVDTSEAEEVGKAQQDGIAKGIEENKQGPIESIVSTSSEALDALKDWWESESPSLVTQDVGKDIIDGLAIGLGETESIDSAMMALNTSLLASFEQLGQLGQSVIPEVADSTNEFTQVTLGDLISRFSILSGETIPVFSSAMLDESIPAIDSMSSAARNLTTDLDILGGSISDVSTILTGQLVSALKLSEQNLILNKSKAEALDKVILKLAERYLALAAAIGAANNAGSGISSPPVGPGDATGTSGATPSFQQGGSFIVPEQSRIPSNLIGPSGGLLVEVHSGELVNVTPKNQVNSQIRIPLDNLIGRTDSANISSPTYSGAGVVDNRNYTNEGSTRGGDTFVLNVQNPVGSQGDVISNFRLMQTLARN